MKPAPGLLNAINRLVHTSEARLAVGVVLGVALRHVGVDDLAIDELALEVGGHEVIDPSRGYAMMYLVLISGVVVLERIIHDCFVSFFFNAGERMRTAKGKGRAPLIALQHILVRNVLFSSIYST